MKISLFKVFKCFACLAFFLMFFPFIVFINGLFLGNYSVGDSIIQQLCVLVFGVFGYSFSILFQKKRFQFPVRINLLFIFTCLFPIMASIAFFQNKGIAFCIFTAIFSVLSYISGNKLYDRYYSAILSDYTLLGEIAFNLIFIYVLWLAKRPDHIEFLIGDFLCILLLYGIIANQSNIDYLMERRDHKFENLPKNIRLYNIKLLLTVILAVLLCFLLKDWIITAIYWIGNALGEVFNAILYLGYLLMTLLSTGTNNKKNIQDSNIEKPKYANQTNNIETVFLAVFIAILVVLIIKKRRKILHFLISFFQKICGAVKNFLQRTPVLLKPKHENEYYYDKEAYISPKEIGIQVNEKRRLKEWSKSCKKFYKMANSSEKVRFGYKLIIEGLNLCGLEILKSDTTNEILDKSGGIIEAECYTLATEEYNSIRYGDQHFHAALIEKLNDTIQMVSKAIRAKSHYNQSM